MDRKEKKFDLIKKIENGLISDNCCLLLLRGSDELGSFTINDLDCFVLEEQLDLILNRFKEIAVASDLRVVLKGNYFFKKVTFLDTSCVVLDVDLFVKVRRYWWDLVDHNALRIAAFELSGIIAVSSVLEFVITFKKELLTYGRIRPKQRVKLRKILDLACEGERAAIEYFLSFRIEEIKKFLSGSYAPKVFLMFRFAKIDSVFNLKEMIRWIFYRNLKAFSL